jgi:UDP-N-acetylmuramoylalanine--D-glutamate ligase
VELLHKKVLVVGLGKSGLSVARYLSKKGAQVGVSELQEEAELDSALLHDTLQLGIALETGGHKEETFLNSDMIIVSPGVPLDMGLLIAADEAGVPILGELELASRLMDTPLVAVTGTNGKSTATAFLGFMLKDAGLEVFVGGNIGTPLMDYAAGDWRADYAVVEVSSFQLDTTVNFSPMISLLLNISPDHLDRYPDYGAYVQSKLSMFKNQGPGQYAILNDDDQVLSQFAPPGGVSVLRYGRQKRENRQAHLERKSIKAHLLGEKEESFGLERFKLPGRHNLENLMGVILIGLILGIGPRIIQRTIEQFQGLPNRLELVGTIRGVDFYNDSKATNVDAAIRSVATFDRPIILIAGGRHKGADYLPLVNAATGRVRKAIFMGEAKHILADAFKGMIPFALAEDMRDAVSKSFSSSESNDVVLLAPACSSFDMFTDYSHRGRVFREEVERLDHGE